MAKTLQDRLKEAYAESNFGTYAALARASGIKSPSTISDLMRGKLGENGAAFASLARALNVEPLWLQKGQGPKSVASLMLTAAPEFDSELLHRTVSAERLFGEHLKELMDCYLHATEDGRAAMLFVARFAKKVNEGKK